MSIATGQWWNKRRAFHGHADKPGLVGTMPAKAFENAHGEWRIKHTARKGSGVHPPDLRDLVYELVYDDAGEVIEDHEGNRWLEAKTGENQVYVPSDMFVYGPGLGERDEKATGNPHVTRESVPGLVGLSSKYR